MCIYICNRSGKQKLRVYKYKIHLWQAEYVLFFCSTMAKDRQQNSVAKEESGKHPSQTGLYDLSLSHRHTHTYTAAWTCARRINISVVLGIPFLLNFFQDKCFIVWISNSWIPWTCWIMHQNCPAESTQQKVNIALVDEDHQTKRSCVHEW